jgi:acyl-coenzyme A synthetase/AMP-(fatty) acid ligase
MDVLAEDVFETGTEVDCRDLKRNLHVFCMGRMPSHLVPREVVVVRALPKNSAGKVLLSACEGLRKDVCR